MTASTDSTRNKSYGASNGPRLFRALAWLAPGAVAAVVCAATLVVWDYARDREQESVQARFDRRIAIVTAAITERIAVYEQVLRGVDGLFQGNAEVDRTMWWRYAQSLHIEDSYPGIQALGFARSSDGAAGRSAKVTLLEATPGWAGRMLGRDLYEEPARRGALEQAVDQASSSLSGQLVIGRPDTHSYSSGFELYLPVYRGGTTPLRKASPAQRRNALLGYVYCFVDLDEMMQSILAEQEQDIVLTMHDGGTSAGPVLFQSAAAAPPGLFSSAVSMAPHGHPWMLQFSSLATYDVRLDRVKSRVILFSGLTIALLLASLVWALNRTRGRALALAAEVEGKYRHPVEAAAAILYVWHVEERRYLYVAPQIELLLGYPSARWTDENFWITHVHPEDQAVILQLTRDLNTKRIDRSDEYRMIAADGRTVWIRDIVKFDSDPGRETVYGVMLDVTEIKRAETALRQSEELFRSAMDYSSIGMALVAPEGRFLRVNRALCMIVGYQEDELLAVDFQSITHPEDLDLDLNYLGRMLRREIDSYQLTKRYIRKDGTLVWILLSVSLVWNNDGTPRYFVSQIQDISDRRTAEQALRESERRFRNLVETANVIPYAWDILAKRYIYVGPQIERLFGQAADLWSDRSFWLERLHPDDREKILAHSQSLAENPRDTQLEYRILRPDGAVIWVNDVIKVELADDGRPIGYGIILDVTQNKERDAQLQQTSKMQAVGQLTSGVAHDFNNLLGVVIGNLDLLLNRLPRGDKRARSLAEDALSAALLGGDITKRLLAFSRRQPLHSEPVDLNELTMQTVALLRHTIGGAIVVRTRLAKDVWPVEADPAQFETALTNLAINARDAMAQGGWLTIKTVNRSVSAEEGSRDPQLPPGDYVELTVMDTGQGMSKDVAERAFDPFFTTKETGQGSGLGLSMVYGFVQQSKGHVAIRSRTGHGTAVSIYLPRASAAPRALESAATAGPAVRGDGQIVLVVEDNTRMRKAAVMQLTALGYRTVEAETAQKAMAVLEDRPDIDLLFSDIVMPGAMNGRELAIVARRLQPGLKVLLTSGYSDPVGAEGEEGELLLSKPYRQDDLAQMLAKMLHQDRDEAA